MTSELIYGQLITKSGRFWGTISSEKKDQNLENSSNSNPNPGSIFGVRHGTNSSLMSRNDALKVFGLEDAVLLTKKQINERYNDLVRFGGKAQEIMQ